MTRDDFPYSLQPYAMPNDGGDGTQESDGWTLVLFRAADEAERLWFRGHGFVMEGRRWVRHAPAPASLAETPALGETPDDEEPSDRETGDRETGDREPGDRKPDDHAPTVGGPAPELAV